jgi:hypothetical protein
MGDEDEVISANQWQRTITVTVLIQLYSEKYSD